MSHNLMPNIQRYHLAIVKSMLKMFQVKKGLLGSICTTTFLAFF